MLCNQSGYRASHKSCRMAILSPDDVHENRAAAAALSVIFEQSITLDLSMSDRNGHNKTQIKKLLVENITVAFHLPSQCSFMSELILKLTGKVTIYHRPPTLADIGSNSVESDACAVFMNR